MSCEVVPTNILYLDMLAQKHIIFVHCLKIYYFFHLLKTVFIIFLHVFYSVFHIFHVSNLLQITDRRVLTYFRKSPASVYHVRWYIPASRQVHVLLDKHRAREQNVPARRDGVGTAREKQRRS